MARKLRLSVQLVPQTMWGKNVRQVVPKESWELLRCVFGADGYEGTYLANGRCIRGRWIGKTCRICQEELEQGSLELHEVWEYDDRGRVQRLADLLPVCFECHNALHIGRAQAIGTYDRALRHLAKVNGYSLRQAKWRVRDAMAIWRSRSQFDYELDLSLLGKWIPATKIHFDWITERPVWVGDRIDAVLWARNLSESEALVLDTETTGLLDKTNVEAIEIAVLDMKGRVLYEQRLRPKYRIPSDVIKIHGITNRAVSRCPTFEDEYNAIREILDGQLVISYNSRFDSQVLRRTCGLYKLPPFDCKWQCAMHVYRAYSESSRWARLPHGTHSAVGDCRAILRLIRRMARTRNVLPEFE